MQTKLKVKLIAHTPEADKLVAAAAKLCYAKSDVDTLLDNLTADKVRNFSTDSPTSATNRRSSTQATHSPSRAYHGHCWHS